MSRTRSRWVDQIDQRFEGHLCVRERRYVTLTNLLDQPAERVRRIDFGSKNNRAGKHADQLVEFRCDASGHNSADSYVIATVVPRQQRRESGVYNHEHGRVVRSCECLKARSYRT